MNQRPPLFVIIIALLALLVVGGVGVLWLMQHPGQRPVLVDAYQPPRIVADATTKDAGWVEMEKPLVATFHLTNQGGEPLVIQDMEASCGCTDVKVDPETVAPGQTATLTATVDTSLKLGPMIKTVDVFSNDPATPKLRLTLKATVQAPQQSSTHHGGLKVSNPLKLFEGDCKTCHVDKGVGKSGQALFVADCGMCHGLNGEGGVSPSLVFGNFDDPAERARLRKVIAEGAPNNPSMPPFSQAKGGPLTEAQIDSLMQWMSYQHSLIQQGKLKLKPVDVFADVEAKP
jgi:mono/diheme cytochrome c family protein